MKKVFKWLGVLLLSPLVLFVLLLVLLYIPPVQNWAVREVTRYASEATNMDISVERVTLSFPLDLVVKGVEIKSSRKDPLLAVQSLRAEIQLFPLLRQQVEIDGIELTDAYVNTSDLIASAEIQGTIGDFYLSSHGIDLKSEEALVNRLLLCNADIHVILKDTIIPEDTTSTPVFWKFALQQAKLKNVSFNLSIPADSMQLSADIKEAGLSMAQFDLHKSAYQLEKFILKESKFTYDTGLQPAIAGFDPSHIALANIEIQLDSLLYQGLDMAVTIREFALHERSGIAMRIAEGKIWSDQAALHIPDLKIETDDSFLQAKAEMDWNSIDNSGTGNLSAQIIAQIGKQDMLTIIGKNVPKAFAQEFPIEPLTLRAGVDGNMSHLDFTGLRLAMDNVFFLSMEGKLHHLLDSVTRSGDIRLEAETYNLDFLLPLVDSLKTGTLAFPKNMMLNGHFLLDGTRLATEMNLKEGDGNFSLKAAYDSQYERYSLQAALDSLQLHNFLPKDSLYYLSAHLQVKGEGTDFYAVQTNIQAEVGIDYLDYGTLNLNGITMQAGLDKHQATVAIDCNNSLLQMHSRIDAIITSKALHANLFVDVPSIDWYALRMADTPFNLTSSFNLAIETESNWKDLYRFQGNITKLNLLTKQGNYHLKDMTFSASTCTDSTRIWMESGDLNLRIVGQHELETILKQSNIFAGHLMKQLEARNIQQNELKAFLPDLYVQFSAKEDNSISNYLRLKNGISFSDASLELKTSSWEGINGSMHIYTLCTDSLQLDTIRFTIHQDPIGVKFYSEVRNAPTNEQFVFTSQLNGYIDDKGAEVIAHYFNEKNEQGLELGLRADLQENGIFMHFIPERPTIAFRPFTLNKGNYISVSDSGRIAANVSLLDKDGTGLRIYSSPNGEALQDITFDISRIRIEEILEMFPYTPSVSGILNTEFHYVKLPTSTTMSSTLQIENLIYEQNPMGTVGAEVVYLPVGDNEHLVGVQLTKEEDEILTLNGKYIDKDEGFLEGNIILEHFPIDIANGFIPDRIVGFEGDLDGQLSINGAISEPILDGELQLDSVYMFSDLYSVRFRYDNRPVRITNSRLHFDNFNIYARGNNPFSINGYVDFSNTEQIIADLRMQAMEYELLNAKRNKNSLVYGKVFVSFFSTLKGPLESPVMRGTMNILGKTDVTYVLKDSPLSVDDRLGNLVTFVNFSDTLDIPEAKQEISLSGLDLLMNIQIAQGAQVKVDLSADRENYIELEGGGNLSMQYTPQGDLLLTGRYTFTSGEMKYSLPVIPLKTFNIKSGSYVEFTGNPMNPILGIVATERVRASVNEDNVSRPVNFDVGVAISNSLEQMGLEFTLAAPEDVTVQNQLAAMSAEERGKLAVTMLATGMYIGGSGGGNTGGFNANNALNSFLQGEISNIAGSALKTMDISFGMEDSNSSDGTSTGTDYSFRFAKRFWNNRLSVIVGGRISTGNEAAAEENESFIDDISLEWRLDDSGTRYVKLFHNKNYESILEGEITETGVGVVLRRKVNKLGELFIFRRKKELPMIPLNNRSALPAKKGNEEETPVDNTNQMKKAL